ncbi:uncharacterized protein [Elaeis guineensis]|uniref:uncharacterized protein n=1 Tax=Elaeis guineensis var. tenera TaxID=51953 RepID=UPI003C6CFA35
MLTFHQRNKARLIVKGYSQQFGVDYEEIFGPVAHLDASRAFISLSAQKGWLLYQLDVKSAFLNRELKEDVYVEQPQGFIIKGKEDMMYKLKKPLYGLKQASRAWYEEIDGYFNQRSFERSKSEPTLNVKKQEAEYVSALMATSQAIWLRKILEDIGEKQEEATELFCDNKSAISMVKNPTFHSCTRHIAIKHYFIQEVVEEGEVPVQFCKTSEQLVDIFTKALPIEKFQQLREFLGVQGTVSYEMNWGEEELN